MTNGKIPDYDFEREEIEAIRFMLDELELVLPHHHRYRARFEMIQDQFYSSGSLPQKYKSMLIKIYELATELGFGAQDN